MLRLCIYSVYYPQMIYLTYQLGMFMPVAQMNRVSRERGGFVKLVTEPLPCLF